MAQESAGPTLSMKLRRRRLECCRLVVMVNFGASPGKQSRARQIAHSPAIAVLAPSRRIILSRGTAVRLPEPFRRDSVAGFETC